MTHVHSLDVNVNGPVVADHNMNSLDLITHQLMCRNALAITSYNNLVYKGQNNVNMSRS